MMARPTLPASSGGWLLEEQFRDLLDELVLGRRRLVRKDDDGLAAAEIANDRGLVPGPQAVVIEAGSALLFANLVVPDVPAESVSRRCAITQEMRREGIPCIEVPRQVDKVTRAIDCHSYFKAELVVLPSHAPWLNDYLMEFEDFNLDDTHEHDDQVDPTLDAINILLKGEGGVNYGGY